MGCTAWAIYWVALYRESLPTLPWTNKGQAPRPVHLWNGASGRQCREAALEFIKDVSFLAVRVIIIIAVLWIVLFVWKISLYQDLSSPPMAGSLISPFSLPLLPNPDPHRWRCSMRAGSPRPTWTWSRRCLLIWEIHPHVPFLFLFFLNWSWRRRHARCVPFSFCWQFNRLLGQWYCVYFETLSPGPKA